MNFLRPGTETRLLSIVCPKVWVGEDVFFCHVFLTFSVIKECVSRTKNPKGYHSSSLFDSCIT